AQRLVRKICPHCRKETKPLERELRLLGIKAEDIEGFTLYRGTGCQHCYRSGYSGRTAIFEILFMDESIRTAILEHRPSYEIRKISVLEAGLISMQEAGIVKTLQGVTTFEEVLRGAPRNLTPRPAAELFRLLGEDDPR
ncbi:MAG: secretion system protein E, partial [Planctomycetes bacterium]|nr:secretion system protein E [Planctomycetota bacterium]